MSTPSNAETIRMLFVHKGTGHDPSLSALLSWLPRYFGSVSTFQFEEKERGKQSFLNRDINPRLIEALERSRASHVLTWIPLLNASELALCRRRGIRVSAAANGFTSLSSGMFRDQREYFDIMAQHDAFFVTHVPHVEVLRRHGVPALPMAFFYDPEIYCPTPIRWRWLRRTYPVLFIGSVMERGAENRREILKRIAEHTPVYVVTYARPDIRNVRWLGVANSEVAINQLVNRSAVVLGSDATPQAQLDDYNSRIENCIEPYTMKHALRCRVATTLGAGACYAVERHAEMIRYFVDGEDVLLWEDADEAVDRILDALRHPTTRDAIAASGERKARTTHTVRIRLSEMIMGGLGTALAGYETHPES